MMKAKDVLPGEHFFKTNSNDQDESFVRLHPNSVSTDFLITEVPTLRININMRTITPVVYWLHSETEVLIFGREADGTKVIATTALEKSMTENQLELIGHIQEFLLNSAIDNLENYIRLAGVASNFAVDGYVDSILEDLLKIRGDYYCPGDSDV